MMIRLAASLCLALPLLVGCASPLFDVGKTETVLPVSRAWIDRRQVEYITTDVSDAAMAQMTGANYVPRLAQALPNAQRHSLVERVYKFTGAEQISVFQSAPKPVGAANADRDYSPLWRVVMVQWRKPDRLRELRSEEEVLAAADQDEVALDVTGIVVNCPITRAANGQALTGVR